MALTRASSLTIALPRALASANASAIAIAKVVAPL